MTQLSVIIITKNAARHLQKCLESVKWADEIIVVDSGSTDETLEIAKRYTSHISETDWPGFGPQKNRALDLATGDWILSLDADETLSEALVLEIQSVLSNPDHLAYAIPRLSRFCGKTIRFGDWRNDIVVRLFKKGSARFSDDLVHEKLLTSTNIKTLKNALLHEAFSDMEEVIQKMNQYSTLGAIMRLQRQQKTTFFQAIYHGAWTFLRGYFLRLGFLDGRAGFLLAVSNAQGCYYRYIKAMMKHPH